MSDMQLTLDTLGDHSPCIGICVLDPASGLCRGCVRSGAEIGAWSTATPDEKLAVWQAAPERAARIGLNQRVMQWSPWAVLDWAHRTFQPVGLAEPRGVWTVGSSDHLTTFACHGSQAIDVALADGVLRVERGSTSLIVRAHKQLRVFAYGPADQPFAYALLLPKVCLLSDGAMDCVSITPKHGIVDRAHAHLTTHERPSRFNDVVPPKWAAVMAVYWPDASEDLVS
ncbi:MAG: DUF1289 domain-containing protein [Pseudomonadota bacterium]